MAETQEKFERVSKGEDSPVEFEKRPCNYCGGQSDRLSVVGFVYRMPILYCPVCVEDLKTRHKEMEFGSNILVVDDGDHSIPFLIGVEDMSEMKGDVNMEDWLKKEQERIKSDRENSLKAKGYESLYRFPIGETKITLVVKQPVVQESQGRAYSIFDIIVNGVTVKTGVNMRSPLYREFINRMAVNKLEFSVIRTGEGTNTRYAFKD